MSGGTLAHAISSVLSIALLTSGGSSPVNWQPGAHGYAVAEVQAQLGVLGFNPGPVTGEMSPRVVQSADEYAAAFGIKRRVPWTQQLDETIQAIGTVPTDTQGALVLSVEDDLAKLGFDSAPLSRQSSAQITSAVKAFQHQVGLPGTGTLTSSTLASLAHWTAVRTTASAHWPYQAQPGDSLSLLAWAAKLPPAGFEAANNEHGTLVEQGQIIHWTTKTVRTVPRTHPSPTSPPPPSTPPAAPNSGTTAILANIRPVSDLVVMMPDSNQVNSLLGAEAGTRITVDVAISGEWAELHAGLVKALVQAGNGVAVTGYSGKNLNALPRWGVLQELNWAVHAARAATGQTPTFLFTLPRPDQTVSKVAQSLNLVPMSAQVVVRGTAFASNTATQLEQALLGHPNQAVVLQGSVDWPALFRNLNAQHFVFESLGQIWAGQ